MITCVANRLIGVAELRVVIRSETLVSAIPRPRSATALAGLMLKVSFRTLWTPVPPSQWVLNIFSRTEGQRGGQARLCHCITTSFALLTGETYPS
jgi:hypothetical protein